MSASAQSTFGAYIAGEFRQTEHKREVRSPYDGRVVARVCDAGPADVEAAIAAAERAFAETRRLTSETRATICADVGRGLARRRDELALAICDEAGKPISDAYAEVDRAIFCFELAAAEAQRAAAEGHILPMDLRAVGAGRLGLVRRLPIGPIAAISPFNFPLNLSVHKVAPALATGCPVILKPASQTPTPTLRLAEIIAETAWPKGALSVLPAGRAAADLLVTDDRCKLITFTGSPPVGWDMKARAGRKRVVLELGGNAAVIIDDGVEPADLDAIVKKLIYGAYSYAGQKCISVQRIFIVAPPGSHLYDAFVERFVAAAQAIKVGDPRDKDVLIGPLIDENNAQRIDSWIAEAEDLGARVLCGGARQPAKGDKNGQDGQPKNLLPATLLEKVPRTARAACDEVFGPVCNVERSTSFDDAVRSVNDSRYGLQAALFTRDLGHAFTAFSEIEAGAVVLNEAPSFRIDHMPYGGVKDSGFGREGIRAAIEDMTEPRLLITGTL